MKALSVILFFSATVVLLLHSFVPHEHHDSGNSFITNHNVPPNIIDQIALGFHLTQTDGQLEHFMLVEDTTENDLQFLAVISVVVFGINTSDFQPHQKVFSDQNTSFKSLNVSGFSYRGPPAS